MGVIVNTANIITNIIGTVDKIHVIKTDNLISTIKSSAVTGI